MNSQIVYRRQSISPILFKPEVMGTQTPIVVAGFKGNIGVPNLGSAVSGKFSPVLAPTDFDNGVLNWIDENKDIFWGKQVAWPGRETVAINYLLQFKLAKTKRIAMEQMEKIEIELDNWFSRLRDWVEVLSYQDLSVDEPLGGTQDKGNYFWSWKSKKHWRGATSATFHITTSAPDTSKALTIGQWENAIVRANKGSTPPDEHLILRDARARFYRGQYKYAAIFLGVTTELTLKKKLEEKMLKRGKSRRLIDDLLNNTLGKIFDICESMDIQLPSEARLVNTTRNNAVHKNGVIDRDTAKKCLDITTELLDINSKL